MTLRSETAPLTSRLHLPQNIQSVRWVAVSPVQDSGWIPPQADYYDVFAYIPLDAAQWAEMESFAASAGARGTIDVPEEVASILFPEGGAGFGQLSGKSRRVEGVAFDGSKLASNEKTEVNSAIRSGDALLIQMRVR